jgi:amidase
MRSMTSSRPPSAKPGSCCSAWELAFPSMPEKAKRFPADFNQLAGVHDPLAAVMTFMTRSSIARAWGEFQEHCPLMVAPIYADVPFAAGSDLDNGAVARTVRGMRMSTAR